MADQGAGEIDQPPRHAAGGHDLARQDEEGDREQREGIVRGEHALRRDFKTDIAEQQSDHARETERNGDRNPQEHEKKERAKNCQGNHVRLSICPARGSATDLR